MNYIKEVIDGHLANLIRAVSNKPTKKLKVSNSAIIRGSKFKNYSFIKKIKILIANQQRLKEFYRKMNVPGMRMMGVTQSFHMYDSVMYLAAKNQ